MSINISSLTESDKGREVKYTTYGSVEYGRITSWNERFVFVCYHTKISGGIPTPRYGTTSEATSPGDLEFASYGLTALDKAKP